MRNVYKLIIHSSIFFFSFGYAFSQWVPERKSFIIRSSFSNGEYDKTNKLCNSIIKNYEKDQNINIHIYKEALEFKILTLLETANRIEKTEPYLHKYEELSKELENIIPNQYATGLSRIAHIYSEFEYYKQSRIYLDRAKNSFNPNHDQNNITPFIINQIYVLNNTGYYNEAYSLAKLNKSKIINHFGESYDFKDPKGNNLSGTYTSKYLIEQKRNTANFLNEFATILLNQGDYKKADSLINISYNWTKVNIDVKGRDISLFDNRLLKIENLQHLEQEPTAYKISQSKTFENKDGLLQSLNKYYKGYSYYETSEAYMKYEEFLARYYWNSNFLKTGLINVADGYYNKHKSIYERMGENRINVNIIKAELLSLDKDIISATPENSLRKLDSLLLKKRANQNKSFIPEGHPLKRRLLLKALAIYSSLDLKEEIIKTISLLEKTDKLLFEENSPVQLRDQLYIAMIKSDVLDMHKEAGKTFGDILDENQASQLFPISNEFSRYDNEYSRLLIRTGQFKKAGTRIKASRKYADQFESIHENNYAKQHLLYAELLIETSKMKEAKDLLKKDLSGNTLYSHISKKEFNNSETKDDFYRLSMRENIILGNLKEAQNDYNSIKDKTEKDKINISPLNISIGKFSKAEDILNDALTNHKKTYGNESRHLLAPLNYLSNINAQTGNYSKASNLEALELASKSYGVDSWQYGDASFIEGQSHSILGDYKTAIIELATAKEIYKQVYGKNHIKYAKSLSELSLAKLYSGNTSIEVKEDLESASEIIEETIGKNSIENATTLQNLSFYYLEKGNIARSEEKIQESINIFNALGTSNYKLKLAQNYRVKGKIQQYNKEYSESEDSFKKSLKYFKEIFSNKEHLEVVQTQSSLAQLYYVQGERKDSKKTLNKTTEIYLDYINKYFNYLTEREKREFWKKINPDFEFYKTIAFESNIPSEVETVYNNALSTKAVLLNSSKQLRESITSSKDENVKKLFTEWTQKQELLTHSLASSDEYLQENKIDIPTLQKEVDKLEKTLGEKSTAFKNSKNEKAITWKDVRDKLEENEFAIEIIRYREFKNSFTDVVKYKALILHKDYSTPKVVDLGNGNKLDKRYLIFYRNAMKLKTRDPYSYKAFFKPIHDVVGDNKKLYMSLDGVYNLINLETLSTPDGQYMLDKNQISVVTSTKDIVKNKSSNNASFKVKNALIISNPMYYEENISSQDHDNTKSSQLLNQLLGAEKEGKTINQTFISNNWKTDFHIWDKANENLVKEINSSKTKAYSFLHISTHGFFKPNLHKNTLISELDTRIGLDDPYLRSGLIFKNGGDIYDNNDVLNYNVQEGILTAREVANTSLNNMEMVILSACETGLGEVSSGEGVYGLQRAFQTAGAKTVIISLFKVDDEVTRLLMEKFTKKLLETKNKHEAFIYAKKEIRKTYPEPIYWGSFIMSE